MKATRLVANVFVSLLLLDGSGGFRVYADKKKPPPVKSIRGHVADGRKKSIVGAKVYVRNVNKKTTTVLITDEGGLYAVYGLDPKVDYEVHAEFGRFISEKKSVSSFLNRFDNVFNFELGPKGSAASLAVPALSGESVTLQTVDQVKLVGDWYRPAGDKTTKVPAVLLLHGFGQDRELWHDFIRSHLLPAGFGALSLDLRGHGGSTTQGTASISADPSWRADPKQFPADIEPALQWLKSRADVDENRIAVIGCDLGGDLAFIASGKYEEVRAAVVISGDAENSKRLASAVRDFQPHSILYITAQGDSPAAESARQLEKLTGSPVRVQVFENSQARGAVILKDIPEAAPLVMDWLKKM